MTLDEGLQLKFEGLVAGLDERLVEELLTGPVLLEAGLLAKWIVDFVAVPARKKNWSKL